MLVEMQLLLRLLGPLLNHPPFRSATGGLGHKSSIPGYAPGMRRPGLAELVEALLVLLLMLLLLPLLLLKLLKRLKLLKLPKLLLKLVRLEGLVTTIAFQTMRRVCAGLVWQGWS